MKRYAYGQNFQVLQSSKISWLTPLGFVEVVPGDTVSGRFTARNWSDTTSVPITNRTYQDVFAFYIPYRLMWDEWPDFISGESDSAQIPVTTSNVEFFLEGSNTTGTQVQWLRNAYNLVYNKYFRLPYQPEVDLDNGLALQAPQRQSTFHERAVPVGAWDPTSVDVPITGEPATASVSVDALRAGFAQDRWNKTRDFYGKKYVDYLNALGVQSGWSIPSDPEPIGKAQKDWTYQTTTSTFQGQTPGDDPSIGDPAGFFQGQVSCKIRDTFCPEHGLIYMVGVTRMDIINTDVRAPLLQKKTRDAYWSPEYETKTIQTLNPNIFGTATAVEQQARQFDEYRVPTNLYAKAAGLASEDRLYQATYTDTAAQGPNYAQPAISVYDNLFVGNMGGESQVHYCTTNEIRMLRKSPIRPPQWVKGVS